MRRAFALAVCAVACRQAPAETRPKPARRVTTATVADASVARAPTLSVAPDASAPRGRRAWPFVEFARGHCLPDQLAQSVYLAKWMQNFHGTFAEGEPVPHTDRFLPGQRRGHDDTPTREDHARLDRWESPYVSHVMDCSVPVLLAGRTDGTFRSTPYAIYLPADYLETPTRPRPVLVLVSGGNGDRTRWFLTPIREDGEVPATGGLRVRGRADDWARRHPGLATPIVIGLDGDGDQFHNGLGVFVGRELIEHVIATYLPHQTRATTPYGVESISSGAVGVVQHLRYHSGAFNTLGFLSPYVHPNGIDPAFSLGTGRDKDDLYRSLVARHRRGLFALRISVGAVDDHYSRVVGWYREFVRYGLFPAMGEATYERCDPPEGPHPESRCVGVWPGLYRYPRVGHHYKALLPSFPVQFEWELDTLTGMLDAVRASTE
jgi:hypothetical protein